MRARTPIRARFVAALLSGSLVAVGGCSSGNEDPSSSSTPSTSASADALIPDGDPVAPQATPAQGATLRGSGYTLNLPSDWVTITRQVRRSSPKIDTAGRARVKGKAFTANLNVLSTKSTVSGSPSREQLEELAAQTKAEISSMVPSVTTLPLVSMGDSPTVAQQGAGSYGRTPLYLVQLSTIHDRANYILTFTFPSNTNAKQRAEVVDPVVASFAFTG